MTTQRRKPEDFGWSTEDLRSAYARDGSGPYRYAPDGSGPFSYGRHGSGPWLVGPEPGTAGARFAPRTSSTPAPKRRIGAAIAAGAMAFSLIGGGVSILGTTGSTPPAVTRAAATESAPIAASSESAPPKR